MPLFHLSYSQFRPPPIAALRFRPVVSAIRNVPARDRVIDFGKHKGRMLGSLPSSYLKWVSKNLRARDFEEWACLSDEVLEDPVYQDRVEWEAAERVLAGAGSDPRRSCLSEEPVRDLLDISERFGWDNEDKEGWAAVDFELLGTSKGGRIPRVGGAAGGLKGGILTTESTREPISPAKGSVISSRNHHGRMEEKKDVILGQNVTSSSNFRRSPSRSAALSNDRKERAMEATKSTPWRADSSGTGGEKLWQGRKVGFLSTGHRFVVDQEASEADEATVMRHSREERRERRRLMREQQMETVKREVGVEEGRRGDNNFLVRDGNGGQQFVNPFPGRRSLLDKIKRQGG